MADLTTNTIADSAGTGAPDFPFSLSGGPNELTTYIFESQSSGTNGGSFNSGAWRTRNLNTQTGNTSFATVLTNQFIITEAGTYDIFAVAPCFIVNQHKARLWDVINEQTVLVSQTAHARNNLSAQVNAYLMGRFTTDGNITYEIQHRCTTTVATNGFGLGFAAAGTNEIFTHVTLTQIKKA